MQELILAAGLVLIALAALLFHNSESGPVAPRHVFAAADSALPPCQGELQPLEKRSDGLTVEVLRYGS